jgi:hypothetical protein
MKMKKNSNTCSSHSSYFLDYSAVEIQVERGLEFILSHLGKPTENYFN